MRLDPTTIRQHLASGATDSRSVLLESLRRARASEDPAVWIHLATETEIASEADRIEAARIAGHHLPLFGLPFAVKDNIDVAGWPTTAACPDFAHTPVADAAVVARLREAGAVAIGKTNLDQFATGLVGTRSPYGACRSVFDPDRISGGSSSGSAVALALDQVAFALGTDTAGSGRVPAAFGNLVGLKPTRGVWPTSGVVPACASLDCVSVFTHSCHDAYAIWDIVRGPDPHDPRSRSWPTHAPAGTSPGFVFGVPDDIPYLTHPSWHPLWEQAIRRLEDLGGRRVAIDFTPWAETAALLYEGPWVGERWAAVGDFADASPGSVFPTTLRILEGGRKRLASELFRAQDRLEALRSAVDRQLRGIDVVVLPTAGIHPTLAEVAADPFGPNAHLGRGTNFCNLLDLSALALPAGFDPAGLPFGITLFAPAFHDLALLGLGARFQADQNLSTGLLGPTPPASPLDIPSPVPRVVVAVAGLHMDGLPLNHELRERGGRLERTTRTSSSYRAFRIVRGDRRLPGLLRTGDGAPFEIELWSLPPDGAGSFLASCVRPPLCLGTLELEDGSTCMGFLAESHGVQGMEDITSYGGWRAACVH